MTFGERRQPFLPLAMFCCLLAQKSEQSDCGLKSPFEANLGAIQSNSGIERFECKKISEKSLTKI